MCCCPAARAGGARTCGHRPPAPIRLSRSSVEDAPSEFHCRRPTVRAWSAAPAAATEASAAGRSIGAAAGTSALHGRVEQRDEQRGQQQQNADATVLLPTQAGGQPAQRTLRRRSAQSASSAAGSAAQASSGDQRPKHAALGDAQAERTKNKGLQQGPTEASTPRWARAQQHAATVVAGADVQLKPKGASTGRPQRRSSSRRAVLPAAATAAAANSGAALKPTQAKPLSKAGISSNAGPTADVQQQQQEGQQQQQEGQQQQQEGQQQQQEGQQQQQQEGQQQQQQQPLLRRGRAPPPLLPEVGEAQAAWCMSPEDDLAYLEALRARAEEHRSDALMQVQQQLQALVQAALRRPPVAAGVEQALVQAGAAPAGTATVDAGAAPQSAFSSQHAPAYRSRLWALVLGDVVPAPVTGAGAPGTASGAGEPSRNQAQAVRAQREANSGPEDEQEQAEEEEEDEVPGNPTEGYMPEVEVLSEVVDALMGVKLPTKAFYGVRARTLAALTIDQAKTQCRLWMDICGPNFARMFISKEPRLLVGQPVELLRSLQAVSTALGLTAPDAVQWALRNGSLLVAGLTEERLAGSVEELRGMLGLERAAAQTLARRHTMLLTHALGGLQQRYEVLAALLPVERGRLAKAVCKRPVLLSRSPQALALSLVRLAALLNLPFRGAALVVAAEPGLTGLAVARLVARWQRLRALARWHAPWWTQLNTMAPPQVARCLTVPEGAVSRLAFVLNSRVQDLAAAQDLKRLLTMSQASYQAQLMAEAWRRQQDRRAANPRAPGPAKPAPLPVQGPQGGLAGALQPAGAGASLHMPVVGSGAHSTLKVAKRAGAGRGSALRPHATRGSTAAEQQPAAVAAALARPPGT